MAAASTKTTATTELPEFAQKVREQLISTVQQGQQMSLDAAKTWVNAVSALPVPELPTVPGIAAIPGVESVTKYTFDLAAELLDSTRTFAVQLTSVLAPKTSV